MALSDNTFLCIFYAFSLAGQLVLTACFLTVIFARLRRDLTLINAAISGLIFSTACLMLLFAQEFRGPPPRFSLCLAQACLIYGSLAMTGSAVFCLFFQLWHSLRRTLSNKSRSQSKPLGVALRVLPWIAFTGMCLLSLVDGLRDRKAVTRSRDFFYCSGSRRVGYASEVVCGSFMLVSVLLQVHIAYMIVRGWNARTLRREVLPLDSIVRMGIFTVYGSVCIVAVVVLAQYPDKSSPRYPFVFISTIPVAGWLIFWTQRDLLETWACRRRGKRFDQEYSVDSRRTSPTEESLDLRVQGAPISHGIIYA